MDESVKAFVFTIAGSILGSITTIVVTIISKKEETKKNLNEMIIKSAIENWKGGLEIVKLNRKGIIPPLDAYIISAAALYENIELKSMNKEKILKSLEKLDEMNNAIMKFYNDKYETEK